MYCLETLRFFAWAIVNNTKTVGASSSERTNRSSTSNLPVTSSSSSEGNLPADRGDYIDVIFYYD